MPIVRRSNCFPLPVVVCPIVSVVMLESQVARYLHCVENVACIATAIAATRLSSITKSYNRTDNYRQWNAVGSPDDGHKDAGNMLRYY
jgi:hypothetical protein